jgi:hypothetical protein
MRFLPFPPIHAGMVLLSFMRPTRNGDRVLGDARARLLLSLGCGLAWGAMAIAHLPHLRHQYKPQPFLYTLEPQFPDLYLVQIHVPKWQSPTSPKMPTSRPIHVSRPSSRSSDPQRQGPEMRKLSCMKSPSWLGTRRSEQP